MPFKLTPKQVEANRLLGSGAKHILLVGGSRSGKTFLTCRAIATRAIKAAKSRHAIFRQRFNHCKGSIALDTFPKMMSLCYPRVKAELDRSDWFFEFPNGSEVWIGGLDDKERVDKVLGREYASIYLNECSQIGYAERNTAVTRLAQLVEQSTPTGVRPLASRMYYDLNPRTKAHWTHRLFMDHIEPTSRAPLADPENYAWLRINPRDNLANLPSDYIQTLESLPAKMRKRFLDGEYADDNSNALWTEEMLDSSRLYHLPPGVTLVRIAVAIDPSAKDTGNEAGIVAGGVGSDGRGYLLEDATIQGRPSVWAERAVKLYHELKADRIVAEANNGGQMVEDVIFAQDRHAPVKLVTASRGKITRAEPISALYERGMISHVGAFPELEDEMMTYAPPLDGATAPPSPNRMDALVWLWTYLMSNAVADLSDFQASGTMRSMEQYPDRAPERIAGYDEVATQPGDEGLLYAEELTSARMGDL